MGAWIEMNHTITLVYPEIAVAPLVGAWIEIVSANVQFAKSQVAPLVGAWIEINVIPASYSLYIVAPLVGAWIEIDGTRYHFLCKRGRSPCGSVD